MFKRTPLIYPLSDAIMQRVNRMNIHPANIVIEYSHVTIYANTPKEIHRIKTALKDLI